ncbi:MAG: MerR family transcriptional regulator [Proteobacteria bacterium]|nr:MerR family transcriptional regulator [Pseudomonadota bacterium]
MTQTFISLREIARQLNIPPSTVVYYKDRFAEHIPSQGGEGRRKRYPADAIEIFRRIREMFNNNWSTEQIEQELAAPGRTDRRVDATAASFASPLSSGGFNDASAVLAKVTDLLENQSLFKSEVRTLRDEIAEMRKERSDEKSRYGQAITVMEREMEELRHAKEQLERMLRTGRSGGTTSAKAPQFPSEDYLARPLVIRTSQSEYLGVLGKVRKHFALRDFVYLVETNASGRKVDLNWEKQGKQWTLVVTLEEPEQEQHFILVTQETTTPNKNRVTEIVRLNVNGADVPDSLLLSLFKKIKDTFDRQSQ